MRDIRLPTPSESRSAVAGARCILAAATWVTPGPAGRLFGIRTEENPAAPYLSRLYGAREALMAADLLGASDPRSAAAVARRHLPVDAVDVAASVLGAKGGYLPRRAAWLTGLAALVLFVLGVRGSRAG